MYTRCIVGWKVSRSARTAFVLDALGQALHARQRTDDEQLIHHSDRACSTCPFATPSVCSKQASNRPWRSVDDSYDNALAETTNGLYKTQVIHRQSWKDREAVELATLDLDWLDWFNHKHLPGRSGTSRQQKRRPTTIGNRLCCPWQRDSHQMASQIPGAVQRFISSPQRQFTVESHGRCPRKSVRPPISRPTGQICV